MFLLDVGLEAAEQRKENCASTDNGVRVCEFSHGFKALPNGNCLG